VVAGRSRWRRRTVVVGDVEGRTVELVVERRRDVAVARHHRVVVSQRRVVDVMVRTVRPVHGARRRPDVGQHRLAAAESRRVRRTGRHWHGALASHLEGGDVRAARAARRPLRCCRVAEVVLTARQRRAVVPADAARRWRQRLQSVRSSSDQTRVDPPRVDSTSTPLTEHHSQRYKYRNESTGS